MSGIPSLAFAVGVYLPLSSSTPLFIGGLIRGCCRLATRRELKHTGMTEEQLVAETDKSPGVLMASGYIAGGAIAGIVIAFMAVYLTGLTRFLPSGPTPTTPSSLAPTPICSRSCLSFCSAVRSIW